MTIARVQMLVACDHEGCDRTIWLDVKMSTMEDGVLLRTPDAASQAADAAWQFHQDGRGKQDDLCPGHGVVQETDAAIQRVLAFLDTHPRERMLVLEAILEKFGDPSEGVDG